MIDCILYRWSLNSDSNGGWPETTKAGGGGGGDGASASDSFGIPEFEPGKPWKGPGLKNPDEDPNLTPGSAASAAAGVALPIGPLSKAGSANNLAPTVTSSDASLTSPTWSFGQNKNEGGAGGGSGSAAGPVTSKASAEWPTSNGPTPTSSTLTQVCTDRPWQMILVLFGHLFCCSRLNQASSIILRGSQEATDSTVTAIHFNLFYLPRKSVTRCPTLPIRYNLKRDFQNLIQTSLFSFLTLETLFDLLVQPFIYSTNPGFDHSPPDRSGLVGQVRLR